MRAQVISFLVLPALLLALAACGGWKSPFAGASSADIKSVCIERLPPGQTVTLPPDKMQLFAELLCELRAGRPDDRFNDYAGQSLTFTIEWKAGRQTKVCVYPPFIILNGEGYRAEGKSIEALSAFGNRILSES